MNHDDHVALLRDGIHKSSGVWADLGSGRGAFTLALADLLSARSTIYSIDRDKNSLGFLRREFVVRYPNICLHTIVDDFNHLLQLPKLDGIVMANSLHFQTNQLHTLHLAYNYLKPSGRFLLVEYNICQGNFAVPYPVSFNAWSSLAERVGFVDTHLIFTRPSSTFGEIYSACSRKPIE